MFLQPEELLLYSLVNVALPPGTKLGMCSAEKYAGISLAIYKLYGVYFPCVNIKMYFYRSINNVTKGLGNLMESLGGNFILIALKESL